MIKKITHLILALACAAHSVTAQDFYLKAGTGYAFPLPGQKIDQNGNVLNGTVSRSGTTAAYDLKNASYSSGIQAIIGGGVMLSKNIGIEVSGNINLSPVNYSETMTGLVNTNGITYDYVGKRKANNSIMLLPSLLLTTANAKWNVYMRMGLAVPLNTGIKLIESYSYQSGAVNRFTYDITNYFSLGFNAASGVSLKLNKTISLYGEVSMLYLGLSREEMDMTSAEFSGRSYPVSQLKGGPTQYHYNKNGISDQYGNLQALPQPFGNLSASLGLQFSLSSKCSVKKS